jgi:hypothetical protein
MAMDYFSVYGRMEQKHGSLSMISGGKGENTP